MTLSTAQIKKQFFAIASLRDLATFFDIKYQSLTYIVYGLEDSKKYRSIKIPKRGTNKFREINAPFGALKRIQRKLASILYLIHEPRKPCHGFSKKRDICSNARTHLRKKIILNLDFENFFPSITLNRVIGLFKGGIFNFNNDVARALAKICCYNNSLPQGAPTSPVVSNFICISLDNQLRILAKDHGLVYTRYADDITFSSKHDNFPEDICLLQDGKVCIGQALNTVIHNNSFIVNSAKNHISGKGSRQIVTGIIVNKRMNVRREYIRSVRAVLYKWEKYGEPYIVEDFSKRLTRDGNKTIYLKSHEEKREIFTRCIIGRINFIGRVRGKHDLLYRKILNRFNRCRFPSRVDYEYNENQRQLSSILELIKTHKETLQMLEIQKAKLGISATTSILHGINDANAEIIKLRMQEKELRVIINGTV